MASMTLQQKYVLKIFFKKEQYCIHKATLIAIIFSVKKQIILFYKLHKEIY